MLCAVSTVLALSIPYNAQSRLPSVPQHNKPQNERVMLAFSETGIDGEHQIEIPLGVRIFTGIFDKLIIPSVAEKVSRC
jgi:hypothetical protein